MKVSVKNRYQQSSALHRPPLVKLAAMACFLFMATLLSIPVFAQKNVTVKGRVISDHGQRVPTASITVKETGKGVSSDANGDFQITTPVDGTLVISSVGFVSQEVKVNNRTNISIVLKSTVTELDQVVVVGYGTQRKKDVTGSVSSVSAEAITKAGVTSAEQVLQGRVAGVQLTQNTGLPGGGSSIQIRGLSSINSTNEPIFVIDGVIISAGTGTYNDNAFSSINPADIETIDVLKDASATAIYGAQGANGVIIITTKKGKVGAPRVVFDAKYGLQTLPKYLEMTNLQEYAQHHNEYSTLKGWPINDYFANPSLLSKGTNWQREIFRPANLSNYNLSVSGGNENTTYKLSGNYLKQEGIAAGSGFDRIVVSTGIDTKVKPWVKMGGAFTLSQTKQVITIADWNLINSAVRQSPSVPARNLDGTYGGPEDANDQLSNPLALAELHDKGNKKLGARGNVYIDIKPFKSLALKSEFATDINQEMAHSFIPTYKLGSRFNSEITNEQSQRNSNYWSWRNIATYSEKLGKMHTVNAMFGHELTERRSDFLSGKRFGGSNQLTDLSAGDATTAENNGYTGRSAFNSFFGRLFYSLNDKYMITGTLRYDGSSNFADGKRWGMFPSTAFAWRVSEENFLKDVRAIDNLKLRLGYGKVGNSNIRQFAYTAMLTNVPTIWGTGQLVANVPNPEVTWESTQSYNVGLDLGILKNRIELVADAYLKKTDNLLLELTLPGITGTQGQGAASPPWGNIGSLENKGIELALNTININKKDFEWRSNFVFTQNRNKVLKLNSETSQINSTYQASGSDLIVTRTEAGRSIGEFYGYKAIGRISSAADIYDKDGNIKIAIPEKQTIHPGSGIWVGDLIWDDYNKDGVINEKDRQYIGSPLPKFTFGFGNSFTYKNFDLNLFFNGSYGNKVMNFLNLSIDNPNSTGNVTKRAGVNYARLGLIDPTGSATDINNVKVISGDPSMPRMSLDDVNSNNRLSSRFVEDASYLRLQNVALSYTFPKKLLAKAHLSNVKVYASAQNVYTFTKYSGYDPEVGMLKAQYGSGSQNALLNGIDPGRYPTPRNYTLGLSIGL